MSMFKTNNVVTVTNIICRVRLGAFAPTLPVADASKVRLGAFAPTLPVANPVRAGIVTDLD